jgi:hypothetical protein
VTPDRLADLESERRFLLRSLDDLEREHAAGDVDDADYDTLRDGYISRTAAVLRELEQGRTTLTPPRPRRWGRTVASVAAVVAVAVLAGWLVANQSGQRLPGQVATGGSLDDRPAVLLSQARALGLNNPMATLELYDRVLAVDPDNVEALTYRAWVLTLVSAGASPDVLNAALARSRADLAQALELDERYADAWCFAGIIGIRAGDPEQDIRLRLDRCLGSEPPAEVRSLVEDVLERLNG